MRCGDNPYNISMHSDYATTIAQLHGRQHLKRSVTVLAAVDGTEEVKYIHGKRGMGTWTFLGGHDPEDYQHRVGDPPTDLDLYPTSPGYRLILNNILFPAARKKPQKT